MKKIVRNWLQIILLVTLPIVIAFYTGSYWRYIVMFVGFLGVIFVFIYEKWSLQKIGIRLDNFRQSFAAYFLTTICGLVTIFLISSFLGKEPMQDWQNQPYFQYIFLISALFQEVGFRVFFLGKLKELFHSPLLAISIHAVVFGMSHMIFPEPVLLFFLTTILGFVYGFLYHYRPNLILITISHAILVFAVGYCQLMWVSDFLDK